MSVFCQIEEDYLELVYSDAATNILRHYEDKDEFEEHLERRKGDDGEIPCEDDREFDEENQDDEEGEDAEFEPEDESDSY
jgi:hypothetical protein